jgi:hypothetical protein
MLKKIVFLVLAATTSNLAMLSPLKKQRTDATHGESLKPDTEKAAETLIAPSPKTLHESEGREKSIENLDHLTDFMANVVAYTNSSAYLGTNVAGQEWGYLIDGKSFGYVAGTKTLWFDSKFKPEKQQDGLSFHRLLLPKKPHRACGLINSKIVKSPLRMRKVNEDECICLFLAISQNKVCIENHEHNEKLEEEVQNKLIERLSFLFTPATETIETKECS